jgi:hypothetical protein
MGVSLSIDRLVRVSVDLSPLAAARRNFGVLCIAGNTSTSTISNAERLRFYTDAASILNDGYTSTSPEYIAAGLYFSQTPKPKTVAIGKWLTSAYSASLAGGALTTAEQTLSNWTSITSGTLSITINGSAVNLTGLNFSTATSLGGTTTSVRSILDTALTTASVSFVNNAFVITSDTTGASSTITYCTGPGTTNDVGYRIKATSSLAAAISQGGVAETASQCATALMNASGAWYALSFASATAITDAEYVNVAAVIQPASPSRIFGVTTASAAVLDSTNTGDIASLLKAGGYTRTMLQYSFNPYAVCSLLGKALSVDYNQNRSTINLMWKTEPGVTAEGLTESQAQTLKNKRCNVFATYNNDTAIIQYGQMCAEAWIDEITGLDWFRDALQNAEWNLLYQSKRKIPQTDGGQHQLVNVAASVCDEAVFNGLVAPGQWNADGFGQLSTGDYLSKGYYIYTPPMSAQAQAVREQRVAPPITIALKLAGAINEMDIVVDVNR